jgi:cyclic lactone autoinducer peptide
LCPNKYGVNEHRSESFFEQLIRDKNQNASLNCYGNHSNDYWCHIPTFIYVITDVVGFQADVVGFSAAMIYYTVSFGLPLNERGYKAVKKHLAKLQGIMPAVAAFTMSIFIFGTGCNFLLHQPKVPAKLRETE